MRKIPAIARRQLYRPNVDYALCLLLKRKRLRLPQVDPAMIWPDLEAAAVTLTTLPKGAWAAPTNDTIVLMKIAAAARPLRILELGSYRGYTAKALLEHAPAEARLTAVDLDPQHGEAYLGTPLEARVDRRVAPIGRDAFSDDERQSFDLVFVDADHAATAVSQDSAVALEMVSPTGTLLWHDYSNWGYFTGDCGVPEVVNKLAEALPLAHLLGSNIAIHRPEWVTDPALLADAIAATALESARGHWNSGTSRPYA